MSMVQFETSHIGARKRDSQIGATSHIGAPRVVSSTITVTSQNNLSITITTYFSITGVAYENIRKRVVHRMSITECPIQYYKANRYTTSHYSNYFYLHIDLQADVATADSTDGICLASMVLGNTGNQKGTARPFKICQLNILHVSPFTFSSRNICSQ